MIPSDAHLWHNCSHERSTHRSIMLALEVSARETKKERKKGSSAHDSVQAYRRMAQATRLTATSRWPRTNCSTVSLAVRSLSAVIIYNSSPSCVSKGRLVSVPKPDCSNVELKRCYPYADLFSQSSKLCECKSLFTCQAGKCSRIGFLWGTN